MLESNSSARSLASTDSGSHAFSDEPSVTKDVLSIAKIKEPLHILFVVHGIGSSQPTLQYNESKLKEALEKVLSVRGNLFSKKLEIKMLDWKSFLVEEKFHKIEEITLKNHENKRHMMNTIPADILFYLSKSHSKKILTQIVKQANAISDSLQNTHEDVRFSFLAHSLGSVIAYDLLQRNYKQKTETTKKSSTKLKLSFDVDYLFNIGSPLSLFLTISHDQKRVPLDELGFIKGMFNIYHPHDLFAYRLEPTISSVEKVKKSIQIPFYKNDGYRKHKENSGGILNLYCCPKKRNFVEENNMRRDIRRYDFELQESFLEYWVETLGLIESHTSYWRNADAMYFILRIVNDLGY